MQFEDWIKKEVEVFGVTYDRYVLLQLYGILARQLALEHVVEMPSHGAKAAGSLYSIGFGLAGCRVTLVNPEREMMYGWQQIGITEKVATISDVNVYRSGFEDGQFDMAWNFVTWTELADPPRYIEEMKRISKNYVMLITCNFFQPGYPWHRFLHLIFGFPWTHGQVEYNHITRVKKLFRQSGIKDFRVRRYRHPRLAGSQRARDVRLHRRCGGGNIRPKTNAGLGGADYRLRENRTISRMDESAGKMGYEISQGRLQTTDEPSFLCTGT